MLGASVGVQLGVSVGANVIIMDRFIIVLLEVDSEPERSIPDRPIA